MADGAVNSTLKSGSTVPLTFEVFAGSSELKDPSAVLASVTATKVDCNTGVQQQSDEQPQQLTAQGGTSLRYDTTAG